MAAPLVGNQTARAGLTRAMANGRLPHALLFYGPAGVGKRAAADSLAAALLCENPTPDACDACDVCRRVGAMLHPDLKVIEPDGRFIKVDAVRTLVRESYLKPYEGRAKVYLVLHADRCNDESANTLLKTLEEPPPSTYLILIANGREAVLPTIRSRCHAVEFRALPRADLARLLIDKHGLDEVEAALRARLGEGSETAALDADLDLAREHRALASETLLPLASGRLRGADAERVVRTAETMAKKGGPLESFLFKTVRPLVRDALLLAAGGDDDLTTFIDDVEPARQLAAALGQAGASALLVEIDRAETDLVVNVNKKLLIEALLLGVYQRAVDQPSDAPS